VNQWVRNKVNGLKQVLRFDNWLQLVVQRLFFSKENIEVYRINGLHIISDRKGGDENGARQLIGRDHYQEMLDKLPISSLKTVFDLGANNGGFPLLLKLKGAPLQRVLSVEFNPNTFLRLQFNLNYNLAEIAVALNAAVTGNTGWFDAEFGQGSTGEGIDDMKQPDASLKPSRVRCVTFDELHETYAQGKTVDLVKMDIEGAEFDVLASSSARKLSLCRYLLIEIHEHKTYSVEWAVNAMKQMGLHVIASPPGNGSGNWLFKSADSLP
jgi:FkbM family methyltransferase